MGISQHGMELHWASDSDTIGNEAHPAPQGWAAARQLHLRMTKSKNFQGPVAYTARNHEDTAAMGRIKVFDLFVSSVFLMHC